MELEDKNVENLSTFELLKVLDDIILEETNSGSSDILDKKYLRYSGELTLRLFEDNDYIIKMVSKIKSLI